MYLPYICSWYPSNASLLHRKNGLEDRLFTCVKCLESLVPINIRKERLYRFTKHRTPSSPSSYPLRENTHPRPQITGRLYNFQTPHPLRTITLPLFAPLVIPAPAPSSFPLHFPQRAIHLPNQYGPLSGFFNPLVSWP